MSDATHFTNKLAGQRVLIIGGSSGIGYAVAEGALESGMTVTIASSSSSKVAKAVSDLQSTYPGAASRISGDTVDVGDPASLESNITALLARVGPLDHVVHTAGSLPPSTGATGLAGLTVDQVRNGPTSRTFAVLMLAKHAEIRGSLILTTGSIGQKPPKGYAAAAWQSSGAWGLVKGLALDLAPARVNGVSPGAVETPIWDAIPESRRQATKDGFSKMTTTGKIADARDVAEAYLYLMKDRNVTGQVISTEGGYLLL